jgi:hypothetical protein
MLKDTPPGQAYEEQGIFKGYFHYSVRPGSRDNKVAIAVGVRPPVVGMQLELNDKSHNQIDLDLENFLASDRMQSESTPDQLSLGRLSPVGIHPLNSADPSPVVPLESGFDVGSTVSSESQTGQKVEENRDIEQQTHLAQQIFKGEIGRYAKSWAELSQIAHFRSNENKEQGDAFLIAEGSLSRGSKPRKPASNFRHLKSTQPFNGSALEIEPIAPEEPQ